MAAIQIISFQLYLRTYVLQCWLFSKLLRHLSLVLQINAVASSSVMRMYVWCVCYVGECVVHERLAVKAVNAVQTLSPPSGALQLMVSVGNVAANRFWECHLQQGKLDAEVER